jgi:hypothetical protein
MTRGAREVSVLADSAAPYMVFQFYYGARPVGAARRKLGSLSPMKGLRSLVVGYWLLVPAEADVVKVS